MARREDTALIVVGLLLILAHSCATEHVSDVRTVGSVGSLLPSPSSYLNSYDSTGYNRYYNTNPYGSSGYYNNYYQPTSGLYARQGSSPSLVDTDRMFTGYSFEMDEEQYYSNWLATRLRRIKNKKRKFLLVKDITGLVDDKELEEINEPNQSPGHPSKWGQSMQEQRNTANQMCSDPKAAQPIATQSNVQQSILHEASLPIQQIQPTGLIGSTPMIGNMFHHPYGMRSLSQPMLVPAQPVYTDHQYMRADENKSSVGLSDDIYVSHGTLVPSELHYFDPSQQSGRQGLLQNGPTMGLTYNPEDMVKLYGPGNFQPPVFSLWQRESPNQFRGLQSAYQYNYPPIDYRFLNGALQQQYLHQRGLEHPLQKLRQTGPLVLENQPLPPNVYRAGKWEPVTNLRVENPVNLAQFENPGYGFQGPAGYPMEGARESSSTPLCRAKRQNVIPAWMYQLTDWSNYDSSLGQQRAAATLPGLPPPMTPYHGPFAPLSEIFPSGQPLGPAIGQTYPPGFTNPQVKGTVEGIQHLVSGIARMVPMFTGPSYPSLSN